MFLNDEQVGKYIRLLCAQHQKGRLNEKDMLNICKTYDQDIFEKFTKDEAGLYFNKRLESEHLKRKAYSKSRSDNRKSKKHMKNISSSYEKHMENENEDININVIKDEIENPFNRAFLKIWDQWKDFKKTQFNFMYKTTATEQAAITILLKLSEGNEQTAIEIINQSIGNGWKGFFKIDNSKNGKQITDNDIIRMAREMEEGRS